MVQQTQEREFSGFTPGDTAREVFSDGTYLAHLDRITEIDTAYGPSWKLWYTVPSADGQDRITVTELASQSRGTASKFMRRIAAVNGLAKMPKDADLARMHHTGPVLVTIARNEDSGYMDIEGVMPCPADADTGEVPNF